jgi:hypothetical protein
MGTSPLWVAGSSSQSSAWSRPARRASQRAHGHNGNADHDHHHADIDVAVAPAERARRRGCDYGQPAARVASGQGRAGVRGDSQRSGAPS